MKKYDIQIKKIPDGYSDKILAIEKESFSDAWTVGMLDEELKSPTARAFAAFAEDGLTAYIFCRAVCGDAEILRIAASKKSRRQGYASALLAYTLEQLKNEGIKKVFLEVDFRNLPAKKLYEKYGFQKISVRRAYYEGKYDAEIYSAAL